MVAEQQALNQSYEVLSSKLLGSTCVLKGSNVSQTCFNRYIAACVKESNMTSLLPIDNDYLVNTLIDLLNIPSPTGFTQTTIAY